MPLQSNEPFPKDLPSPLGERPKLELKPRSDRADRARRRSTSAKGDPFASPFGNARPREEVLKARGVDVKAFDSKIEEKATKPKFTKDQETQLEKIRANLTEAEALFREANEKELPEEVFRVQVEEKRKELNDLVEKFGQLNSTVNSRSVALKKTSPDKKNTSPRGSAPLHSHSPASEYPKVVGGSGRRR